MNVPRFVEVLPEGEEALWITLSDGLTRLIDLRVVLTDHNFSGLRFPRLIQGGKMSDDGRYIYWPCGAFITVDMVAKATTATSPVRLLALLPERYRYRPLLPLLRGSESEFHTYLDVRPEKTLRFNLGIKEQDWKRMFQKTAGIPRNLVVARVSDLYLLLSGLFPIANLPMVVHQAWPIIKRGSGNSLLVTIAQCITAGRYELIEYPFVHLLSGEPNKIEDAWHVLKSDREKTECLAATHIDVERQASR